MCRIVFWFDVDRSDSPAVLASRKIGTCTIVRVTMTWVSVADFSVLKWQVGGWGVRVSVHALFHSPASSLCSETHRYCSPRSASCLGFASSTARRLWQVVQSLLMLLLPSFVLWLPSWQRKHPG